MSCVSFVEGLWWWDRESETIVCKNSLRGHLNHPKYDTGVGMGWCWCCSCWWWRKEMMMWMGGTDDEVIDVDSSECTYLGSSNGSRFVESSLRQLICLLEVGT